MMMEDKVLALPQQCRYTPRASKLRARHGVSVNNLLGNSHEKVATDLIYVWPRMVPVAFRLYVLQEDLIVVRGKATSR